MASGATDRAQIDISSYAYPYNSNEIKTFTYTSNANYYINQITIDSTTMSNIPETAGSFSPTENYEYRVYRTGNTVKVDLRSVNSNVSIVGYAESVFNLTSESAAVTVNSYSRAGYFTTTATATLTINNSYNIKMRTAGSDWIYFNSTSGSDYAGDAYFTYTISGTTLTINFSDLPNGPIRFVFGADEKLSNYSVNGGTATIEEFIDNQGYTNVVVTPQAGYYVTQITVDNTVTAHVEYYMANIYGAGSVREMGYTVQDVDNTLNFWYVGQYTAANIVFTVSQINKPTYSTPVTGGAMTGTVVTANSGGEARMVGFDYDSTTDGETITFIAVNYTGYRFAGWSVDGEILEGYNSSAAIPYELVKDKVVTAVFEPIDSQNSNGETDNGYTDDIV